MIKLIATDIDDTLLEEGTTNPSPLLYETIRALHEKGILFVAASGRQYHSMRLAFRPVEDQVLFVAENGSLVMRGTEVLRHAQIPVSLVQEVADFIRSDPANHLTLSNPETLYLEEPEGEFSNWLREGYRFHVSLVNNVMEKADKANKLALWNPDPAVAARHEKEAQAQFGDRINATLAGGCWIDFMGSGVSKGQAICMLQEMYGITREETMAFGDSCNDISLLEQAGQSYAVENAHPDLKKIATQVIGPCRSGSVLEKIRELL